MNEYKPSSSKGFRYLLVIIEILSKSIWCIPLSKNFCQAVPCDFSINLTILKRKPNKIESHRGTEFYKFNFPNFLKKNNIQHYSGSTDKRPSVADQVLRIKRILLKKPVFGKRKSVWVSELPSIAKKYDNTLIHSTETAPSEAFKEVKDKTVFSNFQDTRRKREPEYN